MKSEIGSNFWVEERLVPAALDTSIFNIEYEDVTYTSSGRDSIRYVLRDIDSSIRRALLPEFTCDSVIQPFIDCGYEIAFYPINRDLCIDVDDFSNLLYTFSPDIVYIHNYFGFNTSKEILKSVDCKKKREFFLIEDITQALYSNFERIDSDYVVGSFRKWAGLADGGFALKRHGMFKNKPTEISQDMVEIRIKAMQQKRDYMNEGVGDKTSFIQNFHVAEAILDEQKEVFRMSDYSLEVQASLDIKQLKSKRRDNYSCLLSGLIDNGLFDVIFAKLFSDVSPLYFPIMCRADRTLIQNELRNRNIYAPVVWPRSEYIGQLHNKTDYIYSHILSIPCDQRYEVCDMERIVDVLKTIENNDRI